MYSICSAAIKAGGGLASASKISEIPLSRLSSILTSNCLFTYTPVGSDRARSFPPLSTRFSHRSFSSSSPLLAYDKGRRPSKWEAFSRKYEPEINRVMGRLENFTRHPFIGGVTNGQILLLIIILGIFLPINNWINFFLLIGVMVLNMVA